MKKQGRNLLMLSVGGIIAAVGVAVTIRSLTRTRRAATPASRASSTTATEPRPASDLRLPDGSPVRPAQRADVAIISLESHVRSITLYADAATLTRQPEHTTNGKTSDAPEMRAATPTADEAIINGDEAPDWQWVGNIRTHIYHRIDGHFLPSESNREYFASEDDAMAAGYRRAANE